MSNKALGVLVVFVIVASLALIGVAYGVNQKTKPTNCTTEGSVHTVIIQNDRMIPNHVGGKLCDSLKIVDRDNVTREVAFGRHNHHTAYDGVEEKVLHKGQSLTVLMDERGPFLFHDHFHDEVAGSFTVR